MKLSVYLNYDEWKMLTLKAEKVGYNKSALVRSILNQIARRAHYQGYIEDEKFLRKMENELQNLILNIKRKYLLPEKKHVSFCI